MLNLLILIQYRIPLADKCWCYLGKMAYLKDNKINNFYKLIVKLWQTLDISDVHKILG